MITTILNQFDKYLYQSSQVDSEEIANRLTNEIDVINEKLNSLYDILKIIQNNQSQQSSLSSGGVENSTTAQINNDSIQSLLSLGKELSGVDLVNETAQEIKTLSFEKAELLSQLSLNKKLRETFSNAQLITIDQVNQLIVDVNNLTKKVIQEKILKDTLRLQPRLYFIVIRPNH